MTHRSERLLGVSALARVEGEGAMRVTVRDGRVEDVRLSIYEPPRFFEAFLRGRAWTEPPDITARICGICPVAYQLTACAAIEDACGVAVHREEPGIAALRRLLYCGEWIESHTLHVYLLHAPDFLGLPDALTLARTERATVERGLRLKKAGNDLLETLGGRAIHPVNVRLGGFHRLPTGAELARLERQLTQARRDAEEALEWVGGFDFPELEIEHALLALSEPDRYAIDTGTPLAEPGGAFPVRDFERHVTEHQVAHSTALQADLDGRRHLCGPLARWNLNHRRLPAAVQAAAAGAGLGGRCTNPFRSIVVRAAEVLWAVDESLRIIADYRPPSRPHLEVPPRAGIGYAATEAPRGTLYHRYELDAEGGVRSAVIVPPTAQNQRAVESDLRDFVQARLDLDDAELTRQCEQAIRNYDPCISCAAHFLDLTVDRG
ncbi:Ni/Fe hydrogenase subunit alpha [Phaeacidiphilus oryzae]|uniref:Ni/Fe hydrogenase subunit alpha n=1 Tax=Phaeacidiphilus oryzae TaxID=348818 RepID=UPI000560CFC6|nr:Ni/Fe hydrogenase subunit alpha [Phaeacidiphilus oryzae]